MITTDKNYQAVIVNAEQPDDSEITVKKVWDGAQNNEKEPINIELWAVPKQDSSMSGDETITVVVATDYYIGSADSLVNYEEGTRKITLNLGVFLFTIQKVKELNIKCYSLATGIGIILLCLEG